MKIFIIVGMPAAGKNIARVYAETKGIPYFATGDLVRHEVRRRGLEPDAANTALVSTEMRGKDGLGVTRLALAEAERAAKPIVFIEGMRSWPEISLVRESASVVVVAFIAPRLVRRSRIMERGRSDDSVEAFVERDERELAYGVAVPIALADEYVLNTGSIDNAMDVFGCVVRRESTA
ncbi:MAG: AAA family ATPase [Deltaproteobacteria bacterium]|nr:AAA family ATPase [Deltaproteobacteria bacterium]